jgi:protein SCO1/2
MRRLTVALGLAAALACAAPAFGAPRDARDIPLVDQTGTTFTLRQLGRPAAVIFVATRCGDACPIAEALFAKLDAALARAHVSARLLTISLEPELDPPIAMANLARRFSADPARWRWASGDPANVRAVLDAFGVYRVDDRFHGAFCYVLGSDGSPLRVIPLSTIADRQLFALLRSAASDTRAQLHRQRS